MIAAEYGYVAVQTWEGGLTGMARGRQHAGLREVSPGRWLTMCRPERPISAIPGHPQGVIGCEICIKKIRAEITAAVAAGPPE